jgi:maltose alpha-D-glucosyltransferase/alpha-amylase
VAELSSRQPGAQGSNTAVILGDRLFLKGYRRLDTGVNPEVEIGRFLTEVAHFPNIVPVAGAVEYVAKDGAQMRLAVLQGYVENQGDGWSYTQNYLERYLEQHRVPTETPTSPSEAHGGYLALVQMLGRRTAAAQGANIVTGDPAFDQSRVTRYDNMDEAGARRGGSHSGHAAAMADALPERYAPTGNRYLRNARRFLSELKKTPAHMKCQTRYHGIIIWAGAAQAERFLIIDLKASRHDRWRSAVTSIHLSKTWRVCGVLSPCRLHRLVPFSSERPEGSPAIESLVREWEAEVTSAFLRSYEQHVRDSGLYAVWDEARVLLDLFMLEKAFYELRYELNNRPLWAPIPLRGILGLNG